MHSGLMRTRDKAKAIKLPGVVKKAEHDDKYPRMRETSNLFPDGGGDVPKKKVRMSKADKTKIADNINYFRTMPKSIRESVSQFFPQ